MIGTGYLPYRIMDLARGTRTNQYYQFFRSSLKWSEKEIRSHQRDRLKEILKLAFEESIFYRRRFEECNFHPEKFRDLEDLQVIPPLTREDLQEHLEEIMTAGRAGMFLRSSSSGTTGIPVTYYQDIEGYSAGVAAGFVLWSLAGWKPGQKSIHIWGNPESVKRWKTTVSRVKRALLRQRNFPAHSLNQETSIPQFIRLYKKFRPQSIDGYSQSVYTIAEYLRRNGILIEKCRNILGTAENLFPHQKDCIEKYLGPFSDLYGFGEINGVAIKPAGSSNFIVMDSRVFLESSPLKQSGTHEMIVTDLFNTILPLIRYKPGDLFSGINGRDTIFSRFSTFSTLYGRTANIIELPNGISIHPVNLLGGTFFRNHMELKKHKVTWDGTELHFIFEVAGNHPGSSIHESLYEYLKPYKVPFRISFTESLKSEPSGKYSYFEILDSHESPENS